MWWGGMVFPHSLRLIFSSLRVKSVRIKTGLKCIQTTKWMAPHQRSSTLWIYSINSEYTCTGLLLLSKLWSQFWCWSLTITAHTPAPKHTRNTHFHRFSTFPNRWSNMMRQSLGQAFLPSLYTQAEHLHPVALACSDEVSLRWACACDCWRWCLWFSVCCKNWQIHHFANEAQARLASHVCLPAPWTCQENVVSCQYGGDDF